MDEALTQIVVYKSLIKGGFLRGTPEVYRIYRTEQDKIAFLMEAIEGKVMEDIFKMYRIVPTKLIVETLFHIGAMIDWLVQDIGMNHRDLKPSNLLIVEHAPTYKKRKVGNKRYTIVSNFDIVFLDYGFSCIGEEMSLL